METDVNNQKNENQILDDSNKKSPDQDELVILDKQSEVISLSENSNNENREKELLGHSESLDSEHPSTSTDVTVSDDSAKYVSYGANGVAIYTDPQSKCQYKFDTETHHWIPVDRVIEDDDTSCEERNKDNPYENEHYRWCNETNQWIAKENISAAAALENEFYEWNHEQHQWIPKSQGTVVSTNIVDGMHTYTDKDGATFFWDDKKNAWFPKIDDNFMAMYQMSYGFVDNTSGGGTKDGNSKKDDEQEKQQTENGETKTKTSGKRKGQTEQLQWFELPPEQNTKVYVSNLPYDITEEEFTEVMSKCGMIFRDPSSNKFKIKLYAETDGQLKGDGLCHYLRVESVDLALKLLDGSDIRGKKIKVQRATFEMRGQYDPSLKPKKKKKDKEKLKRIQEKLLDWRPEQMRGERPKHERIVIIKNLFTPELFDAEVHLIIDYQKDLREECSKCGTVRKIVIFDRHPEGVAQVNMGDQDEADLVVQMMHKRFFGKRQLTAEIYDGKTNYKIHETKEEEEKRLSNWDQFLEDDTEKVKNETENDSLDNE